MFILRVGMASNCPANYSFSLSCKCDRPSNTVEVVNFVPRFLHRGGELSICKL